ncbi:MKRN2 opposite strand protein [Monomorium pharaonis]|uniref:MKRN2 opposite strand protein n=1 Tax=Monomorium pharaonis TaxID=307658 RepID=UPI00063EF660|nr:MKRN2 opposite strand protein [Monomorium pharaonis]
MNNDPGIVCFRHCSTKSVFSRRVPATCPACSSQMKNFIVDPFHIPYPFRKATHCPTTIVIQPSQGSFLDNYDMKHGLLHAGIVDSNGGIVEFDKKGPIVNDFARWIKVDCIALEIVPAAWTARWDETLSLILNDFKWKHINYDAISMNCFDFVLEFLNNLRYPELRFMSKEDLCERLIVPKMNNAVRYISLYRSLKDREYLLDYQA